MKLALCLQNFFKNQAVQACYQKIDFIKKLALVKRNILFCEHLLIHFNLSIPRVVTYLCLFTQLLRLQIFKIESKVRGFSVSCALPENCHQKSTKLQ